ncbi:hypothetical protein [Endozoicomonas sp.]|uniref:hypothetical protein n=1 Tax=Endozoicomonas sp. TaxID=1892382 RepID=UPI003AF4A94B
MLVASSPVEKSGSTNTEKLENRLPTPNPHDLASAPKTTKANDHGITIISGDTVEPHLATPHKMVAMASAEDMTIEGSPVHSTVAATPESDHEADVSKSESDGKSQASHTSQAEPLPEAKATEHGVKSIQGDTVESDNTALATQAESHQAATDKAAPISDSKVSKSEQGKSPLEGELITATKNLPMREDEIVMMFRLSGKAPEPDDHTFLLRKNTNRKDTTEDEKPDYTTAGKLKGRYRLSVEHKHIPGMTIAELLGSPEKEPTIKLGYIHFYTSAKSTHIAGKNPIPIRWDSDANEHYVDIDLKNDANHVAAYLHPIPTNTSAEVSLSMTRVADLPEKSSTTTGEKPTEAKDKETSASGSQPEAVGNKAASEDDIVELPKAPETDVEESRRDSSLFSCCGITGIRERLTKPHPAAGT